MVPCEEYNGLEKVKLWVTTNSFALHWSSMREILKSIRVISHAPIRHKILPSMADSGTITSWASWTDARNISWFVNAMSHARVGFFIAGLVNFWQVNQEDSIVNINKELFGREILRWTRNKSKKNFYIKSKKKSLYAPLMSLFYCWVIHHQVMPIKYFAVQFHLPDLVSNHWHDLTTCS